MNKCIGKRIDRLRRCLEDEGLDAALITNKESYSYLSNFWGTSAVLVITGTDALFLTDFRYTEQARDEVPIYEIIECSGNLSAKVNEILEDRNVRRLGFEDRHLTYGKFEEYKGAFSNAELVPLGRVVEDLRVIKDEEEIKIIRQAVKIADDAFSHILSYIKPGVKELEIAAEIEYFMKKCGAKGSSFDTIVASGVRSSMPHGTASDKEIMAGDVVLLDYGAVYKGYCSDISRTVFLGTPDNRLSDIYDIVLRAQKCACNGIRRGLTGKEIDSLARNAIKDAGFGEKFGHGLGHGVGIEVHEAPRFSPSDVIESRMPMEDGMVITVEPGIYVKGLGGVRIEDMVIVNGGACEVLTKSDKEIIVL